ncbi:MAG: hypothetical protein ABI851_02740 [Saprospiraceae bacterium]
MKKLIEILICISFIIAIYSCNKEDITTIDPCQNVTCLNGGYCDNGHCVCMAGYTGPDCSLQLTPSQLTILKVELIGFPATNSGAEWDLNSGPDIYAAISFSGINIWASTKQFENANPSSIYEFIPANGLVVSNPKSNYMIRLYDHDELDSDDLMGEINFIPDSRVGGLQTIKMTDANGSLTFRLTYASDL